MYFVFGLVFLCLGISLYFWHRKLVKDRGPNSQKALRYRERYGEELVATYPILQYLSMGFASIGLVMLLTSPITVTPAGHVKVLKFFGKVYGQVNEGISWVNPLSATETMSIRTQQLYEKAQSPSKEGLSVYTEITGLFRLDPRKASDIYQQVGPDYINVIVEPMLRSAVRTATAEHSAKDLYTSGREVIQNDINKLLTEPLKKRGVIWEEVLLRDIKLPAKVANAIDAKLQAEQESEQMQFVLTKEKQEAERKRIEANGIAAFQKIVSEGISPQLLQWKGIEATQHLANSDNAKVVIIGGKDGLPLILNTK